MVFWLLAVPFCPDQLSEHALHDVSITKCYVTNVHESFFKCWERPNMRTVIMPREVQIFVHLPLTVAPAKVILPDSKTAMFKSI